MVTASRPYSIPLFWDAGRQMVATAIDRVRQIADLATPVLLVALIGLVIPLHTRLTVEEETSVHQEDIAQLRTDVALLRAAIEQLSAQGNKGP